MSKHTQRGRHRAAAFHQSIGNLDALIAEKIAESYRSADQIIREGLKAGLERFRVKLSENCFVVVSTKDRHPQTLEQLDEE